MAKNQKKKTIQLLMLAFLSMVALTSCQGDSVKSKNEEVPIILKEYPDQFRAGIGKEKTVMITGKTKVASEKIQNDFTALVDGDEATVWSSGIIQAGGPTVLELDIRRVRYMDRIDFFPFMEEDKAAGFPGKFTIELSHDGKVFTKVISRENGDSCNGPRTYRFAAQPAQYIRITVLEPGTDKEGNKNISLSEVRAYYEQYSDVGEYPSVPGATYYISADGNDEADGLSEATAWRTLERAGRMIYGPGNRILLRRGDVFEEQSLRIDGSGESGNPIIISAYGDGALPVIRPGPGQGHGIRIHNGSHYSISGLAFDQGVSGILAISDRKAPVRGLEIVGCEFTGNSGNSIDSRLVMPYPEMYFGSGIVICCYGDASTQGKSMYEDIRIADCYFDDNDSGIITTLNDLPISMNGYPSVSHSFFDTGTVRNLRIEDVKVLRSRRSGGIMLYGCKDSVIDNAYISETGYKYGMYWGVAACQLSMCENFTVKNSEFCNTRMVNQSPDGEGFDFESGNINVSLVNTYIHDNEGPAILFYGQNMGWKGPNSGLLVEGCTLERNGQPGRNDHSKVFKNYPDNEGEIKNTRIVLGFEGQSFDPTPLQFHDNTVIEADGSVWIGDTAAGKTGKENLALGKPVEVSSDYTYEGYSAVSLTDGERSGLWEKKNGWSSIPVEESDHPEWIRLDLGKVQPVGEIRLYACQRWPDWSIPGIGAQFPWDFSIAVSVDGEKYEPVFRAADYESGEQIAHSFDGSGKLGRYVIIEIGKLRKNPLNNSYAAQVAELEVYGYDGGSGN